MQELTDADIRDYYDRHQAHLDAGLPEVGRTHLRSRYVRDVRNNPEALRQIGDVLRREWHERRARAAVRHQRVADVVFRNLRAGQPARDDWMGRVAEAAEQFARIIEQDAHPDDVALAYAGMWALAGIWLPLDQIEELWLGGDDPATL